VKAQKFIGLDAEKMNADKDAFKKTVLVEWVKQAKEREAKY